MKIQNTVQVHWNKYKSDASDRNLSRWHIKKPFRSKAIATTVHSESTTAVANSESKPPTTTNGDPKDAGRGDIMLHKVADKLSLSTLDIAIVRRSLPGHPTANRVAGISASHRYWDKKGQYAARWGKTVESRAVVPIIIETGGRWHPESIQFLKSFCSERGEKGLARPSTGTQSYTCQCSSRGPAHALRALSLRAVAFKSAVEDVEGNLEPGQPPTAADLRTFFGPAMAGAALVSYALAGAA